MQNIYSNQENLPADFRRQRS